MNRLLPRPKPSEVTAMAVFEPNGRQLLEVCASQGEAVFTRDEVMDLKGKIEAFERAALFEDGRPYDRTSRHREPL